MVKNKKFKTGLFYVLANDYRKAITDEDKIEAIDMTASFFQELKIMIKSGEIIIININAKMRQGKSTTAMSVGYDILSYLVEDKKQPKGTTFGMQHIARDDQEYSKRMRDPNLQNTVIVTDEQNELEHTGENVTVENALRKVFSDVQAGRYVHRVCCSPKEMVDDNADIMLSVIAVDRVNHINRCKLYYRFYEGGHQYVQLLGFVDINVGHIINTWLSVKDLFFKQNKTKKEIIALQKAREEDWYVEYMVKKYEKMELITKEGVFKPRVLDYASIILEIVQKLKPLTRLSSLLTRDVVRNHVKLHFSKQKIPTSIVGEELATREACGVLDLYKSYWRINGEIQKQLKIIDSSTSKDKVDQANDHLDNLKELKQSLIVAAKELEDELIRYKMINEKYHEVQST